MPNIHSKSGSIAFTFYSILNSKNQSLKKTLINLSLLLHCLFWGFFGFLGFWPPRWPGLPLAAGSLPICRFLSALIRLPLENREGTALSFLALPSGS